MRLPICPEIALISLWIGTVQTQSLSSKSGLSEELQVSAHPPPGACLVLIIPALWGPTSAREAPACGEVGGAALTWVGGGARGGRPPMWEGGGWARALTAPGPSP